jgi:hypothetical protein
MTENTNRQAEQTQLIEIARQEAWIKTPFSYIKPGAKLTLLQTDTMLMVSDHLQEYIGDYFNLGLNRADVKPRALFSKYMLEHGIPPFKIYLADMGINPSHYKSVREAVAEMNMLVDHPELDENGRPTGHIIYSPVFTKFRVPQTGDFYRKTNDQGEVVVDSARHYGYIEVEINKDVAQYAFDMSQGYANHPKLIARYASKQSTPKLYFKLLELMGKDRRAKVKLTMQEIKRALGFEPFKDEKTGEWIVPYAKFAHFKTKVLDAVKDDLDRMARENHTDITFDYVPVYLNGRKRGDPDYIEFTIMSTDLGIGYSLLTRKDTPATGEAKKRTQAVEGDLFATGVPSGSCVPLVASDQRSSAPAGMTAEQAQDSWQRCYVDFKAQLGLSGADVWFREYKDGVVTFNYERSKPELVDRLTNGTDGETFAAIVKKYFGQNIVIKYRQSGC